jgi:hypothetical protein
MLIERLLKILTLFTMMTALHFAYLYVLTRAPEFAGPRPKLTRKLAWFVWYGVLFLCGLGVVMAIVKEFVVV